jgi:hypothetical protein
MQTRGRCLSLAPGFSRVTPVITGNKNPFQRVSLHTEAVETASRHFSTVITGLKPGANENFAAVQKNEMHSQGIRRSFCLTLGCANL